jgi:TonB family protein
MTGHNLFPENTRFSESSGLAELESGLAMISKRWAFTGIQGDMMSAYANSLQKPEGFDRYVRKFRSICMMHGVKIGSRMELSAFQRKLVEDRHLAMDFWAFVGKASNREGGELSDDQMLGIVVEGITDTEISEVDGGAKRTVDDLRAMLAGVDIQGPEQSRVEMAPFPRSEAGPQQDDKQLWTHAEELATRPSDSETPLTAGKADSQRDENQTWTRAGGLPVSPSQVPRTPEKLNGDAHHAAVLPATPPPQLDESLLRLELTKLVQQYFDNIDKRISKLEPQADGTESTGTIATAVTRRSLEEPISAEELEELRLRRMGRTRLVLEPAPSPIEGSLPASKDDDDIPMHVPLEHYSPPAGYGKAPLLLVIVLIGAAFAIYRDPTLFRKGFAFVVSQLHSYVPATSPNRSAPPSTSSDEQTSTKTEQSQPTAAQPALEGTSTPPPVNTPDRTASVRPQPANNGSDASSSSTTTNRAAAQTDQAQSDGISSVEAAGAIKVNPDVMDENLIVQRVPAYPEAAKLNGIEGDVVMQALISKEGTVKRVHVMEGDSRLRNAAEEAVYKWRYRPYVLHGQPVEVATTVTVNFNLDR